MSGERTKGGLKSNVELGKEFGGDASPSFINGALGNIITHERSSKN